MQFTAGADHYDRFMGRYSTPLATALADFADIHAGQHVLDVGCGPGALTHELAARVGAGAVAAVDPAPMFAAACRERNPGADVRVGVAEELPWPDGTFDAALACLVLAFLRDPDLGVHEMARVVRPGGTVAACMWDIASGGMTMLRLFWDAARVFEPTAAGENRAPGTASGDIVDRFERAGLRDVTAGELTARTGYAGFDDFWEPFTHGVGPAGQYLAAQSAERQEDIREQCRAALPPGPFELEARAWCARGVVPDG
jgi:SAM-dependent methyltransferase